MPLKGYKQSEEHRIKIGSANSIALKGRKFSKEHKRKLSESHKGENHHFYGKHLSKNHRKNISEAVKGRIDEKANAYKGDKVGYVGLHDWVQSRLGKPRKCEHCKTEKAKKFEWANISRKYKRDLSDWIRLCTSCHRLYDYGRISLID